LIFVLVFYERHISGDLIKNRDIRKRLTKKIDLNILNANTGNKWHLFPAFAGQVVTFFAFLPVLQKMRHPADGVGTNALYCRAIRLN
jgi:hypothetical protein